MLNERRTSADKTLADGDIPFLSNNIVYGGEGIYTGEGVTDYFYMEQETDELMYNEILGTSPSASGSPGTG